MSRRLRTAVFGVGFLLVWMLTAGIAPVEAGGSERPVQGSPEDDIRSVITAYFDLRYQAFASLHLDDFGELISTEPEAIASFEAERSKLAIEIRNAELNRLRYVEYDYFLAFEDFSIDEDAGTATVVVSESHDVMYELSLELDAADPIVSHLYNLEHTIRLREEEGRWVLVSDEYVDYLWRMLNQTEINPDDFLRNMQAAPLPSSQSTSVRAESICGLPEDESTHPYDRIGAMFYALDHIDNYNPDYPDYGEDPRFGDCTNFVSQALYEGGRVSMAFCDPSGPYCDVGSDGNLGWFFESVDFRASAWTHVGKFYEFVLDPIATEQAGWTEGPEGCEVSLEQVELGDVIQYEWGDGDGEWDHAVIVVDIRDGIPYIASHSQDVGPEPYTFFPFVDVRFIRIERSDGDSSSPTPVPTATPTPTSTPVPSPTSPPSTEVVRSITQGSDDGGINPTGCSFSSSDNEVYLGACFEGGDIISGFRFEDVQIPRNAYIVNAFVDFTVDGTYTAPIVVSVYGEANGDPGTFTEANPPGYRTPTHYAVVWYITDTWQLGDHRNSPDLTSVIQEIVNRSDWNPGQAMAILIENAGSTDTRRVIGYERTLFQPEYDSARLVIAYNLETPPTPTPGSSTPSPTMLPSPTNTPVPPTPTPTEVPWICTVCGVGCPESEGARSSSPAGLTGTSTPYANMTVASALSSRSTDLATLTTLLTRVRDDVLASSEEGQRLTALYYSSIPDIVQVLLAEPDLAAHSLDVMNLFVPYLQALVDGHGDTVTISADLVEALQTFLHALVENGSTELAMVITAEMEHHPLENLIGTTMDEAFTYLNGYHLEWRPPLVNSNPYRVQGGRTIPVKFALTDYLGDPVLDEDVFLEVLDEDGDRVMGPIGLSDSPNDGLAYHEGEYHYNLRTSELGVGLYTLRVQFNSEEPVVWFIDIRARGYLPVD